MPQHSQPRMHLPVVPALCIHAVDAKNLQLAAINLRRKDGNHASILVIEKSAFGCWKNQQRHAAVSENQQLHLTVEFAAVPFVVFAIHWRASRVSYTALPKIEAVDQDLVVVQFGKEASQNARLLRPKVRDASRGSPRSPSASLRAGFRRAKNACSRMTIKLHHYAGFQSGRDLPYDVIRTMRMLTEEDVRQKLDPVRLIAALESVFRDRYPSTEIPLRTHINLDSGIF